MGSAIHATEPRSRPTYTRAHLRMAERLGVSGNLDMLALLVLRVKAAGAEEVSLKVNESEVRRREESRCLGPTGAERTLVAVDSEH